MNWNNDSGVVSRSQQFEKLSPESGVGVFFFQKSTLESGVGVVFFQESTPESGVGVGPKFSDSSALIATLLLDHCDTAMRSLQHRCTIFATLLCSCCNAAARLLQRYHAAVATPLRGH